MKVLMTGPGKGHNVKRFLTWFNEEHEEHSLTYLRYNGADHYDLGEFPNVHFLAPKALFGFIKAIRQADFIWVHNWTNWPYLRIILAFKKKSTVLNFNFWSEKLILGVLDGSRPHASFYRKFFAECDVLQTSWFSVKNHVDQLNHPNSQMLRWGFEEDYFTPYEESELSDFTQSFVRDMDADTFYFFVPKSIGFPNRHDLMVEAAAELKKKINQPFKVIFWKGNRTESEVEKQLIHRIEELDLQQVVEIVTHPFLRNTDMVHIWKHMDAGLQLCDQDQLSTAFTEPLLFERPIIASAIPSYTVFNAHFGVHIPLVSNDDLPSIVEAMGKVIHEKPDFTELNKRKDIIEKHYRFSSNMKLMMAHFESLHQKKS